MKKRELIIETIKHNPVKVILLIIMAISFNFIGFHDDVTVSEDVITHYENAGKFHYVTYDNEVLSFDDKKVINDDKIEYTKNHWITDISIVAFLVSLVVFVVSHTDEPSSWELEKIKFNHIYSKLKCDMSDNGKYFYYHIDGKLITRSEYQLNRSLLYDHVEDYIEYPNQFPSWKPKKERRKETIKTILK